MSDNRLSVIIPTYNVEIYLDSLLDCVAGWADEVIVCDSFSTDKTVEIAERHGVRVVRHEYINSAKQKNWIIPQASGEWVLIIDADEKPEEALKKEINEFLATVGNDVDLAYIPRKNLFWGEFLGKTTAYPDYQSRLFRRDKGRYQDKEVHAQVEVPGERVYLKNALVHDDFTDISSWWLRNNRYYRYELDECIKRGRKWGFKIQYARPLYVFLKIYICRGGFLHGFKGLFAAFQWFVYYFMVGAKLYEYELSQHRNITHKSANSK